MRKNENNVYHADDDTLQSQSPVHKVPYHYDGNQANSIYVAILHFFSSFCSFISFFPFLCSVLCERTGNINKCEKEKKLLCTKENGKAKAEKKKRTEEMKLHQDGVIPQALKMKRETQSKKKKNEWRK